MVKVDFTDRVDLFDDADCFKLCDNGFGVWFELRKGGVDGKLFAMLNASAVVSIAVYSEDRELVPA